MNKRHFFYSYDIPNSLLRYPYELSTPLGPGIKPTRLPERAYGEKERREHKHKDAQTARGVANCAKSIVQSRYILQQLVDCSQLHMLSRASPILTFVSSRFDRAQHGISHDVVVSVALVRANIVSLGRRDLAVMLSQIHISNPIWPIR